MVGLPRGGKGLERRVYRKLPLESGCFRGRSPSGDVHSDAPCAGAAMRCMEKGPFCSETPAGLGVGEPTGPLPHPVPKLGPAGLGETAVRPPPPPTRQQERAA